MRELSMAEYPTPVQMQILDYLENGPKRRVIAAFRGCGKSTLSAMYILWRLYLNPEEKVLIVSAPFKGRGHERLVAQDHR